MVTSNKKDRQVKGRRGIYPGGSGDGPRHFGIGDVGMIYGYTQTNYQAEWSSMSLAVQALTVQSIEQARAAKWDVYSTATGSNPDELPPGTTQYHLYQRGSDSLQRPNHERHQYTANHHHHHDSGAPPDTFGLAWYFPRTGNMVHQHRNHLSRGKLMKLLSNSWSRKASAWAMNLRAFTLVELMITMAIFMMLVLAMVGVQIFGFKINTLTTSKLKSTAYSLKALDQIQTRSAAPARQWSEPEPAGVVHRTGTTGPALMIFSPTGGSNLLYLSTNAVRSTRFSAPTTSR
jgi:type II secretory pathway pseudopilin PulG